MQTLGKRKPSPCTTNCCLAASVLNPVADTSSSLLGKWSMLFDTESLGGMLADPHTIPCSVVGSSQHPQDCSGLLRTWTDAMQRWQAAGTEPGNKSAWGRRVSMTHPVQPPDTILQHLQHICKLSGKKPIRCRSSSRSHSILLWRLSYCSKGH